MLGQVILSDLSDWQGLARGRHGDLRARVDDVTTTLQPCQSRRAPRRPGHCIGMRSAFCRPVVLDSTRRTACPPRPPAYLKLPYLSYTRARRPIDNDAIRSLGSRLRVWQNPCFVRHPRRRRASFPGVRRPSAEECAHPPDAGDVTDDATTRLVPTALEIASATDLSLSRLRSVVSG